MDKRILADETFKQLAAEWAKDPTLAPIIADYVSDARAPDAHADFFRRSLPVKPVEHNALGYSQVDGFIDDGVPHRLEGSWNPEALDYTKPLAVHERGPEHYRLYQAIPTEGEDDREHPKFAVKYTLQLPAARVRSVTPMNAEQLHDFIAATPDLGQQWHLHGTKDYHTKLMRTEPFKSPYFFDSAKVLTANPHNRFVAGKLADFMDQSGSPLRAHFLRGTPLDARVAKLIAPRAVTSSKLPMGETVALHNIAGQPAVHYTLRHGTNLIHRMAKVTPEQLEQLRGYLPEADKHKWTLDQPAAPAVQHDSTATTADLRAPAAKLARMKAPAGGAIVNNQYVAGGRFIPRVFARLRTVAAALAKKPAKLYRREHSPTEKAYLASLKARLASMLGVTHMPEAQNAHNFAKMAVKAGDTSLILANHRAAALLHHRLMTNHTASGDTAAAKAHEKAMHAHVAAFQSVKPTKLARPAETPPGIAPQTGAIAVRDEPRLTIHGLENIENSFNLPHSKRLSKNPATKVNADWTFTAPVEHIAKFFENLTDHRLPEDKTKALLRDPKRDDPEKLQYLITHLGHDLRSLRGQTATASKITDWYGKHINTLDAAIHRTFAKSPSDPFFGTLDEAGELVGKDNAPTHHPGTVLFKALIAAMSASQKPTSNLRSAVQAWKAGEAKAGKHDPVLNIPRYNEPALTDYLATSFPQIPQPPSGIHAKGKWFVEHAGKADKTPGYASFPATLLLRPDKPELHGLVVGLAKGDMAKLSPDERSRVRANAKIAARMVKSGLAKTVKADLPLGTNGFQAKGWSNRKEGVAQQIGKLQALVAHFSGRGRTRLEAWQDAARWLLGEHDLTDFDAMSKATKGVLPSAAKMRKDVTAIEPGEGIPGSFVLGPKFGPFMLNLHMNHESTREKNGSYLTADKWFSRTMNRYIGRLLEPGKPVTAENIRESPTPKEKRPWSAAMKHVAKKLGVSVAELQADLWYNEQMLYRMYGGQGMQSYNFGDAVNRLKLARPAPLSRAEAIDRLGAFRAATGRAVPLGKLITALTSLMDKRPARPPVPHVNDVEDDTPPIAVPIVSWTVPIKQRGQHRLKYHSFHAVVNPEQLDHIIKNLPSDDAAEWTAHGLTKLARMPDTAYAFVSPSQPGGNIGEAEKRLHESESLVAHAHTLPGVQRAHVALGVWNGGAEPSAVIHGLPGAIAGIAQALGEKYNQEAVLHFTPGTGSDALHKLTVADSPEKIHADLSALGLSNKTIIPGRKPTVLLVDMGDENREKIAQYASARNAQHTVEPGHAVFTTLRTNSPTNS